MKLSITFLLASFLFISCGSNNDSAAKETFQKNSKTVLAYLEGFQNENTDYSIFSKEFKSLNTNFGATTEMATLEEFKEYDKNMSKIFDFKLVEKPVFLPGVDPKTGELDGSVRFYNTWEITMTKTDSTEAKTARLKFYESYDFDKEGKILFQQGYGDSAGLVAFFFKK